MLTRNLTLAATLLCTCMASPAITPEQSDIDDLRQTTVFALGQVGFAGHISDSEHRYRRLLQAPDALTIFTRMIQQDDATGAAKLYAACAIRTLSPNEFARLTAELFSSDAMVSVLRTDILNREAIRHQVQRIAQHGCNDAYWKQTMPLPRPAKEKNE